MPPDHPSGNQRQATMKRQAAKLVSVSENRREPTERGMQDPKTSLEDIGTRLALTRRVLVLTRFQMARLIGIDVPTWGTYEAGLERIPPNAGAQARPLRHPAGLDLRRPDGEPAPAHPRQNSGGAGPGRLNPRTQPAQLRGMGSGSEEVSSSLTAASA